MKVNVLAPLDETAKDDPRQGFQILCRLCADALQCADRLRALGVEGNVALVHTLLGNACGLLMQMNVRDMVGNSSGIRINMRTYTFSSGTVDEMKALKDESDGFL